MLMTNIIFILMPIYISANVYYRCVFNKNNFITIKMDSATSKDIPLNVSTWDFIPSENTTDFNINDWDKNEPDLNIIESNLNNTEPDLNITEPDLNTIINTDSKSDLNINKPINTTNNTDGSLKLDLNINEPINTTNNTDASLKPEFLKSSSDIIKWSVFITCILLILIH